MKTIIRPARICSRLVVAYKGLKLLLTTLNKASFVLVVAYKGLKPASRNSLRVFISRSLVVAYKGLKHGTQSSSCDPDKGPLL